MKLWHLEFDQNLGMDTYNYTTFAATAEEAWNKIATYILTSYNKKDSDSILKKITIGMVKEVSDGVLELVQSHD